VIRGNVVLNSLKVAACALSGPSFALIDDIRNATREAHDTQLHTRRLQEGTTSPWRLEDGMLLRATRIFVLDHKDLCH
jgi:hypothetical protein